MAATGEKADFGVPGLDDITAGGLARGRLFLLEGNPGTGKTTIATQFLIAGAAAGERGLYITLSETEDELRAGAASHGWDLDGIDVFELAPPESLLDEDQQQSLLYSSDLELGETTKRIFEVFERVKPDRVVLDSLSEIRLLAQSSLRYRRQILALKHYFAQARRHRADARRSHHRGQRQDRAQHRARRHPARGAVARLRRRAAAPAGHQISRPALPRRLHDFVIETGGVRVFPRLVSAEHRGKFERDVLASGSPELDALLGGGIERGSSTLILGPAGTGKSLARADLRRRGDRARRACGDVRVRRGAGPAVRARQGPRHRPPGDGRFGKARHRAGRRRRADARRVLRSACGTASRCIRRKTVVIDSLNGYQAAMPEEQALILHMHELLQYLNRQGATTFLTVAQHGLVGDMKAPVDVTYLADTVILLRYFEAIGRVRRAISVIKKRTSAHEDTIREYRIDGRRHHARRAADRLPGRAARRPDPGRRADAPLLEETAD